MPREQKLPAGMDMDDAVELLLKLGSVDETVSMSWVCPTCTFSGNNFSDSRCQMCSMRRPAKSFIRKDAAAEGVFEPRQFMAQATAVLATLYALTGNATEASDAVEVGKAAEIGKATEAGSTDTKPIDTTNNSIAHFGAGSRVRALEDALAQYLQDVDDTKVLEAGNLARIFCDDTSVCTV